MICEGVKNKLLKQNMPQYISNLMQNQSSNISLYREEKNYAEKHNLIPDGVEVIEINGETRFQNAYVERCEKETIALIVVETPKFLDENIDHLKSRQREFLYVESNAFDLLGIDALSMEIDDVFGTYTALFGLKMSKQNETAIKNYLDHHLSGETGRFSVAYSGQDNLWNMNFSINYIDGFNEDMTLLEAYELVYSFIFKMVETIEENQ